DLVPAFEHVGGNRRTGQIPMLFNQAAQLGGVGAWIDFFVFNHSHVAIQQERVVRVPHIGDATRHAGGEVATGGTEAYDATAGHVFATVVAHAFDDGVCAAVANGESLGGAASDKCFTAR